MKRTIVELYIVLGHDKNNECPISIYGNIDEIKFNNTSEKTYFFINKINTDMSENDNDLEIMESMLSDEEYISNQNLTFEDIRIAITDGRGNAVYSNLSDSQGECIFIDNDLKYFTYTPVRLENHVLHFISNGVERKSLYSIQFTTSESNGLSEILM